MQLPEKQFLAEGAAVSFLWAGPHRWYALGKDDSSRPLFLTLQQDLAEAASLFDQSDAWATVALSGPKTRALLSKLVPVDLDPRVFAVRQTALTLFGHIAGQITRRDDTAAFELMVFRSFAESLWESLIEAGEEYGIRVVSAEEFPGVARRTGDNA